MCNVLYYRTGGDLARLELNAVMIVRNQTQQSPGNEQIANSLSLEWL